MVLRCARASRARELRYNHSFHCSIQEKPVNVTAKNEHELWYRLYGSKNKKKEVIKPKCQVGDKVRLN